MEIIPLELPGLVLLQPRVFPDARGHFLEIFQDRRYPEYGVPARFVQDNISFSRRGVIRGLHYQLRHPQGKLVMPLTGEIWDVVLDIRRNFRGDWTLATAAKYDSVDATKVKFVLPLKSREKQKFTYELTTRHGTNATR